MASAQRDKEISDLLCCTTAVLIAAAALPVCACACQAGTAKMKGQDWNAAKCVVEGGVAAGAHCMVVVNEEDTEAVFPCAVDDGTGIGNSLWGMRTVRGGSAELRGVIVAR